MHKHLHDIEDIFFSALDDNLADPPDNTWDKIGQRMDKDNLAIFKQRYRRIRLLALLLLILSASLLYYNLKFTNQGNHTDEAEQSTGKQQGLQNNNAADATVEAEIHAADQLHDGINATTSQSHGHSLVDVKTNTTIQNRSAIKVHHLAIATQTTDASGAQAIALVNRGAGRRKKIVTGGRQKITTGNVGQSDEDDAPFTFAKTSPVIELAVYPGPAFPATTIATNENHMKRRSTLPAVRTTGEESKPSRQTVSKGKTGSGWSLTAFFSPDIPWYRLMGDADDLNGNGNDPEHGEQHKFSATYGALVDYKLGKHWGFQSGLSFSNTNIALEPEYIYAERDQAGQIKYRINTSSGYGYVLPAFSNNPAVGDSLAVSTTLNALQYLSVPVAVTYRIEKNKFSFNLMSGVSVNLLTAGKLATTVSQGLSNSVEKVEKLQGLKKVYLSGLAGIGVSYKLAGNLSLNFAPTFRFALNAINHGVPVKSYPMSFGFATGLKLNL